jgi:hypothetical protein
LSAAGGSGCHDDGAKPNDLCLKQRQPYEHGAAADSPCTAAPTKQQGAAGWAAVLQVSIRRLQQAPGGAGSNNSQVELNAVLDPSNLLLLGSTGAGLLGAGQLLASGLEQQADGGSSNPAGGVPQLLRVMLAQRVGVCGNGLCEVGERQLLNAEGEVLQEAAAPCAQDCPGTFMLCPAPVGPVGYPDRECGGNGRCIRETGTCDCSAG